MEKSTVYFTDFRCPVGTSQLVKLKKLCVAAGIKDIDMDGKFVAIKMHFGELGNLAFLRPNYAKVIADLCKEQGGMPFLTDCNTLYPGSRKNALEHLDCANLNGFNTTTTGCQIIIGDGLRGTDEVEVPVVNGEYCKTALIGHAIMDDYGHVDEDTPSLAISVLEEFRQCGIGTALMQQMLTALKQQGYPQVSLSVQKANYAARMYEKLGFEIVEDKEEEYIMVHRL